ncbi:hypothetical protein ACFE35_10455 [Phormidesmis priestleyi ANT.L61.2]
MTEAHLLVFQLQLAKISIADRLQTRSIDRQLKLVRIRGVLESTLLSVIDQTLKVVFELI